MDSFVFWKTVLMIFLPPSGFLIMISAGLLLNRTRFRKTAKSLLIGGLALLYLLSTPLISNFLLSFVEDDIPPLTSQPDVQAIVVLTSGVKDLSHLGWGLHPSGSSIERLVEAIRLYRTAKDTPILISGGTGDPSRPDVSEAKILSRKAIHLGIPQKDILIEDSSRNTHESAQMVKKLFSKQIKKIILVTSTTHMSRSKQFFEEAGFTVIPAPTGYLTDHQDFGLYALIPSTGSLGVSNAVIYEILARLQKIFL